MSPQMTQKKPAKRKKPNPYKAPTTVKRYYAGISYGIDLLRDELIALIDDEEQKQLIKDKARYLKSASNKKLTELEKQKTKQKLLEWEEKEWENL